MICFLSLFTVRACQVAVSIYIVYRCFLESPCKWSPLTMSFVVQEKEIMSFVRTERGAVGGHSPLFFSSVPFIFHVDDLTFSLYHSQSSFTGQSWHRIIGRLGHALSYNTMKFLIQICVFHGVLLKCIK